MGIESNVKVEAAGEEVAGEAGRLDLNGKEVS